MILAGRVLATVGDDITAEAMASSKHVTSMKPEDLAAAAMLDVDPDFPATMKPGGILVAGSNFGCQSSREWAPLALKYAGTRLVIAVSFARIFFRNAIAVGLPIVECAEAREALHVGDDLVVDLPAGRIENRTTGRVLTASVLPTFLLERMEAGGLIPYLRRDLARERAAGG